MIKNSQQVIEHLDFGESNNLKYMYYSNLFCDIKLAFVVIVTFVNQFLMNLISIYLGTVTHVLKTKDSHLVTSIRRLLALQKSYWIDNWPWLASEPLRTHLPSLASPAVSRILKSGQNEIAQNKWWKCLTILFSSNFCWLLIVYHSWCHNLFPHFF